MAYIKRQVTPVDLDNIRINLSVRDKKLGPEPRCDFCGNPDPLYIYAALRMSTGEWVMNWRWMTCGACSSSIDRNDWGPIEMKVIEFLRRNGWADMPRPLLLQSVRQSLTEFILYAAEG